jgi:LacI family transcriptional regulator
LLKSLSCPRFVFKSRTASRVSGGMVIQAPDFCSMTACRLAVEHLASQGIGSFAFVGHPDLGTYGRDGCTAKAVRRIGAQLAVYAWPTHVPNIDAPPDSEHLATWLGGLPRPLGVVGMNDVAARYALEACRHAQLRVPEEIAIIGIDDDEFICELTDPPLSSVAAPGEAMGYATGMMVNRYLSGRESRPMRPIKPQYVAVRLSTDIIGTSDPDLARAIRLIRNSALRGVSVDQIAEQVPMARRTLEARMRRHLGISPAAEIERVRMQHALQMLLKTSMSAKQVAFACGYPNATRFNEAFVRVTNKTPLAYRASVNPSIK